MIFIFATLKTTPDMAYCAGFYQSGRGSSKSSLYVVQNGKTKKLNTPTEPFAAQWIGNDRLIWVDVDHAWTSKLSPWSPVKIKNSKGTMFLGSRHKRYGFGNAQLEHKDTVHHLDLKRFELVPSLGLENPNEILIEENQATDIEDMNGGVVRLQMFQPVQHIVNGKTTQSEWSALRSWYSKDKKRLWVLSGEHSSTEGDINNLTLYEANRSPRILFETANCFDYSEESDFYAYCTPRGLSDNGKKRVWTSELWIGDWRSGKKQNVLKGLTWVTSVSVRPSF